LKGDEIICSDTGNTLAWMMQAFPFGGQTFLHPFNNTPMGYALPAALGASLATGKRIIVTTGDGSIMMALGELATLAKHRCDAKVLLFNNSGHSMCRYTQKQWLGGRFAGTGKDDLAFPDFYWAAMAHGFRVARDMDDWLAEKGPTFLEVKVDPAAGLAYQVRFGKPLDQGDSNK
jgi:acetolactate synthase-1/2/3 large subunit